MGTPGVFAAEGEDWRRARRLAVTALNSAVLSSFTVDVTSALAFGRDLNTLERGDSELQEHCTASSTPSTAASWRRFHTGAG